METLKRKLASYFLEPTSELKEEDLETILGKCNTIDDLETVLQIQKILFRDEWDIETIEEKLLVMCRDIHHTRPFTYLQLLNMWENAAGSGNLEQWIEEAMVNAIQTLNVEKLPTWAYVALLDGRQDLPDIVFDAWVHIAKTIEA